MLGNLTGPLSSAAHGRHGLEVLPDPQPTRVAGGTHRRERVVGADRLVAVHDVGVRPDEEPAVVREPLDIPLRVGTLDLEMLRGDLVGDLHQLLGIVHDDDGAVVVPSLP